MCGRGGGGGRLQKVDRTCGEEAGGGRGGDWQGGERRGGVRRDDRTVVVVGRGPLDSANLMIMI